MCSNWGPLFNPATDVDMSQNNRANVGKRIQETQKRLRSKEVKEFSRFPPCSPGCLRPQFAQRICCTRGFASLLGLAMTARKFLRRFGRRVRAGRRVLDSTRRLRQQLRMEELKKIVVASRQLRHCPSATPLEPKNEINHSAVSPRRAFANGGLKDVRHSNSYRSDAL